MARKAWWLELQAHGRAGSLRAQLEGRALARKPQGCQRLARGFFAYGPRLVRGFFPRSLFHRHLSPSYRLWVGIYFERHSPTPDPM